MGFWGCANPAARESGYNGFELDAGDLRRACRELRGKPVLIEHAGDPVGRVDSAWVGGDGRLYAAGSTGDADAWSFYGGRLLIEGSLPELSLGTVASLNPESLTVEGKQFVELSLVERGLREGTRIAGVAETERVPYKSVPVPVRCSQSTASLMSSAEAAKAETAKVEEAKPMETEPAKPAVSQEAVAEGTQELLRRLKVLEERNQFLEGNRAKQFKTAFNAVTQKFLENLNVEDEGAKKMFINGLRNMAADPSVAGAEGDAVMQVMCAASRQNAENAKKLETALDQLRAYKEAETAASDNGKRTRFENELKAEPPATASASAAPSGVNSYGQRPTRAGRGMAEGNPGMFKWLASGGSRHGMDRVDYVRPAAAAVP